MYAGMVDITLYTDPGCPFGFTAQRQDLQLAWHYGHGIRLQTRMIVLAERRIAYEERGVSRDVIVRTHHRLAEEYGMPMWDGAPDAFVATFDACRAVVGARLHDPAQASLLLRALRRRTFSDGEALDAPETVRAAASDAGIAAAELDRWLADAAVEAALREDMAATREPLPEALALPHKLSKADGGWRYSTGSAVFASAGRRVVAPGFQPFSVHEVAMASVAPEIERRDAPASVAELLAWAPYPLATAEVAELRGVDRAAARTELEAAGESFAPAGSDGYWTA